MTPRKHGIADADTEHAWLNAMRLVEYEYDGEERLLVIVADRQGVGGGAAGQPTRIIHATCFARGSTTT